MKTINFIKKNLAFLMFFAIMALVIVSCKKDNDSPIPPTPPTPTEPTGYFEIGDTIYFDLNVEGLYTTMYEEILGDTCVAVGFVRDLKEKYGLGAVFTKRTELPEAGTYDLLFNLEEATDNSVMVLMNLPSDSYVAIEGTFTIAKNGDYYTYTSEGQCMSLLNMGKPKTYTFEWTGPIYEAEIDSTISVSYELPY